MNVRIKNNDNIPGDWRGRVGKIVAVVKEKNSKEYIVQFTHPTMWSYFKKKEFKQHRHLKG